MDRLLIGDLAKNASVSNPIVNVLFGVHSSTSLYNTSQLFLFLSMLCLLFVKEVSKKSTEDSTEDSTGESLGESGMNGEGVSKWFFFFLSKYNSFFYH